MAQFKDISPNASAGAKLTNWFENRFPTAFDAYRVHMSEYYAPKNFNFWYIFGSLALLVLVIQIVTGIFLVMHYKPDAAKAFESVEYCMAVTASPANWSGFLAARFSWRSWLKPSWVTCCPGARCRTGVPRSS